MDSITLGQVKAIIGTVTVISGFFIAIFRWYSKNISNKITDYENRIKALEVESHINKEQNTILLKGQLACLKGLKEQGCNGPVTQSINEIEAYLLNLVKN